MVPKFSYDEMKKERDALLTQSRDDAARIRELEKDLVSTWKLQPITS